jgi:hypothetical protein
VYLGGIGVVMWPLSLVVILATKGGGDRVIRTLLVDPYWKPWLLAVYAVGWVGSIVLLVSGTAFRRGSRAGRYGLIGCAIAAGGASICGAVFNLACMPAILASLPPPISASERLRTYWTTNLVTLFVTMAAAGSAFWLLTRPEVIGGAGREPRASSDKA